MPPLHSDAIGYVRDLASEENSDWFRYLCDAAIERTDSGLTSDDRANLHSLLFERASYLPKTAVAVPTGTGGASVDFLEEVKDFSAFKRLGPSLSLTFPKRATIIFGTNGSGKSSICEALRALADPARPTRPLHNVTQSPPGTPSFSYRFRNGGGPVVWNQAAGYGSCAETIKYFDSSLASKSLVQNVDPGTVISLAPFHLASFGRLQEMTTAFRDYLQHLKDSNLSALELEIQQVQLLFKDIPNCELATLEGGTACALDETIKAAEKFTDREKLTENEKRIADLQMGLSEEGLKLLRAEVRELAEVSNRLSSFIVATQILWHLDVPAIDERIEAKTVARKELEKIVIGDGVASDSFSSFLEYAARRCNFGHPESETCPLCRQPLSEGAKKLFKTYHEYISGKVAEEIRQLKQRRDAANKYADFVSRLEVANLAEFSTFDGIFLEEVQESINQVMLCAQMGIVPTPEALAAVQKLKDSCSAVGELLESKSETLTTLATGREETEKTLKTLRAETEPLKILDHCVSNLTLIKKVWSRSKADQYWTERLGEFSGLFRRITAKAKLAHEELIVADFETRLDGEYRTLTNKGLEDFSMELRRQGRESSVTLIPKIAGSTLAEVLSEGEQRVHALALFFAELQSCAQSVIIFDDPVSSFDYNYVGNYCRRLRDYLQNRADSQVIILTHNWEFFVQLQVTLNKAGLNNFLSVQVLENCSTSAAYSEKIDDLKATIDGILTNHSEPSRDEKETLAGAMRRLIESVVNTHVFANQRHQYKQKTLQVSAFADFTKLVALDTTEAQTFSDLYADLSITEHDDPRNAYVNTDRATFVVRYQRITRIETAILARKVP